MGCNIGGAKSIKKCIYGDNPSFKNEHNIDKHNSDESKYSENPNYISSHLVLKYGKSINRKRSVSSVKLGKNENSLNETNEKTIKNTNKFHKKSFKEIKDLIFSYNKVEIISYPKLIVSIFDNPNNKQISRLEITPNSINGKIINSKFNRYVKFTFGKNKSNSYVIQKNSVKEKQFSIYSDNKIKKFYVHNDKTGAGIFIKINKKISLFDGIIISFYEDFMYINVESNKFNNNSQQIKIKFIQDKYKDELVYNSIDKKIIKIGRDKSCDFVYESDSISKVQCTLVYEFDSWVIYDGLYHDSVYKPSTNGLWLLANFKFELKKGTIFKSGILRINIIDYIENNE